MARPKKNQVVETADVIGGTLPENEPLQMGRGDVALAVSLPGLFSTTSRRQVVASKPSSLQA